MLLFRVLSAAEELWTVSSRGLGRPVPVMGSGGRRGWHGSTGLGARGHHQPTPAFLPMTIRIYRKAAKVAKGRKDWNSKT